MEGSREGRRSRKRVRDAVGEKPNEHEAIQSPEPDLTLSGRASKKLRQDITGIDDEEGRSEEKSRDTRTSTRTPADAKPRKSGKPKEALAQPSSTPSSSLPNRNLVELTIMDLLSRRQIGATICPSEVARKLAKDWRPLMEHVRNVADDMVQNGKLEITQGGRVVGLNTVKGPIRIRLVASV